MAQDLLEMGYENAVSTNAKGYYRVDYSQIDVQPEIVRTI